MHVMHRKYVIELDTPITREDPEETILAWNNVPLSREFFFFFFLDLYAKDEGLAISYLSSL